MKTLAVTGFIALVASVTAACGGSDNGSATTTKAAASSTTGATGVTQAVTQAYESFFDGGTSADKKIALVENGPAFAQTINAQADSPLAKGTKVTVSEVLLADTEHADVTYTVLLNGTPALENQQGAAVKVDNQWLVAASTFCALLTLEGGPPPVCTTSSSATPTR
jgi:hypothetical protein